MFTEAIVSRNQQAFVFQAFHLFCVDIKVDIFDWLTVLESLGYWKEVVLSGGWRAPKFGEGTPP